MVAAHWVKVVDAYKVHYRLENTFGNVLGEYYQLDLGVFVSVCYPGEPRTVGTEQAARESTASCPAW